MAGRVEAQQADLTTRSTCNPMSAAGNGPLQSRKFQHDLVIKSLSLRQNTPVLTRVGLKIYRTHRSQTDPQTKYTKNDIRQPRN